MPDIPSLQLGTEGALEAAGGRSVGEPNASLDGGRATRKRSWLGVSTVVLGIVLFVAVAGSMVAPHDPTAGDLRNALGGASSSHLLGTDAQGQDVLSRILAGARYSVLGALLVVTVATALGTALGGLAGYRLGWIDATLGRLLDLLFAMPPLLLAIAVVAVLGRGFWSAIIALMIAYTPYAGRFARTLVVAEASKPYRLAAQALGLPDRRILGFHILPAVGPLVLVQAVVSVGFAVLDLAALSFLGLGVQAPHADWGLMISEGSSTFIVSALPVLAPGLAVLITVLSLNFAGERLRRWWAA